ncbi:MAG: Cna B-type domain-containing protein, partial [Bacillota bacterium]|nr:Cna B-type domain-containing protein [Bacillota bacterium]
TEVSGIKTWNDGNNEENRPDEIVIQLYQNGQKYSSDLYPEGQTTTNADSDWEYSFSQLPKYDEDGQLYEYTIEEVATNDLADNYISIVDGYDITNTSTIDLDGEKIWLDGNDKEGKRPNSIKIQLYQGTGTDKSKYEPYGEELEIKKADDWKYTFENLPEYDADGNRYIYTIKEVDVPNGYEVSYPSSGEAAEGEAFDIDIVNSLLMDVSGEKIWKDFFDSSDRPDEITVQLIRYIGEIQEDMDPEIIGTAEVTAADGWKYSFTELPAYTPNGVAYTYDVIEITEVEGYTCNNDIEGSYDIVNTKDFTFVPPPGPDPAETIELSGEKIWKDDSSPNRPDEITIQLYQMVGSDAQTMTEYGDPVKVTYSDRWKYSFTALPKYDASETAYTYMVKEVEVPEGYIVSYEGTDIINTKDPDRDPTEDIPGYTPPTVKLSVGGQKIWDDMDDYAKMRPDEITVQLYQDGVAFGDPVTITAEDDWKYSFNDLPKFDAADPNSVDYVYTIEEVNVPEGYAVRYDGYNIINDIDDKYLPKPPEKATDTGDHSNVLFWTLQLMLLSAICMILVLLRRKKPTRNNY